MRVDKYGQHIYTLEELFSHYMRDPLQRTASVVLDEQINFHSELELDYKPQIVEYSKSNSTIEEYDVSQQRNWLMPERYKTLDIVQYILDKCSNDTELERAGAELVLYQQYELFDLLRYMVYLVDTMRANNIVWGVGRGSSIASYVLYLIGIHRINSIVYGLDIREFLK